MLVAAASVSGLRHWATAETVTFIWCIFYHTRRWARLTNEGLSRRQSGQTQRWLRKEAWLLPGSFLSVTVPCHRRWLQSHQP